MAADRELTGPVNIGHGQETSVLDLLAALDDVSERPLPAPQFEPERPGEVRRSCLDVTRARTELGWTAEVRAPRRSAADPGRSLSRGYRFSATSGASRVKYHQPSTNTATMIAPAASVEAMPPTTTADGKDGPPMKA